MTCNRFINKYCNKISNCRSCKIIDYCDKHFENHSNWNGLQEDDKNVIIAIIENQFGDKNPEFIFNKDEEKFGIIL